MPLLIKSNSLLTRLVVRIFGITLIAIMITYAVVYLQIDQSLELLRNQTVEEQAQEIRNSLRPGRSVNKLLLDMPRNLRVFYANADYDYQYLVRDQDGTILFRSTLVYPDLFPKNFMLASDAKFKFKGPDGAEYSGVTIRFALEERLFYIQAAQTTQSADRFSDQISSEFMKRVLSVGVPFYCALLLIILITVRRGFKPLQMAAKQVENANITNPDFQIPEHGLPQEITPFIKTINFSFKRLARSIQEQKEMTENLAHELRTPLAVLKANIEQLGRDKQSTKILRDVDAMIKLVNQMLDMTRLEYADMIEMHEVDLSEILSQVCQDLWPLFLKDHRELRVSGIATPVLVRGNKDLIYRAIRNVLDNAREHSPPKTPVDVSIEGYVIKVRDYGPTIPADRRAKIFGRLHRLGEKAGAKSGAGLGLSIVSKTMEVHRGRALLEPAPVEGNIFLLDFKEFDSPEISSLP